MPIDLRNNISLTASADIKNMCSWFFKKNNLTYFLYGRFYGDGRRFNLSNRDDWVAHYYQRDYPNIAKLEKHPTCYHSCYVLWDDWDKNCISYSNVMKIA